MLRMESVLKGYQVQATDGMIGSVSDFLVDDSTWGIRWLVVDTGGWLGERRVLLHPSAIGGVDELLQTLSVRLTTQQVKTSPDIFEDQPVSRQMEQNLYGYYGWDPLWGGPSYGGGAMAYSAIGSPLFGGTALRERSEEDEALAAQDPHLRSMAEVAGYHIHASDGGIGHVEGFLIDDQSWRVRYLVVDTRNWRPGQHVLLAPVAVTGIDWEGHRISLDVTREQVRTSPAWCPDAMLRQEYQRSLHAHYNWPGYGW
jgi:hypothetical protein